MELSARDVMQALGVLASFIGGIWYLSSQIGALRVELAQIRGELAQQAERGSGRHELHGERIARLEARLRIIEERKDAA